MYLILLFAFVSICLTSKLSLKVSCDKLKPGEKNLSSAFDDSDGHEIK